MLQVNHEASTFFRVFPKIMLGKQCMFFSRTDIEKLLLFSTRHRSTQLRHECCLCTQSWKCPCVTMEFVGNGPDSGAFHRYHDGASSQSADPGEIIARGFSASTNIAELWETSHYLKCKKQNILSIRKCKKQDITRNVRNKTFWMFGNVRNKTPTEIAALSSCSRSHRPPSEIQARPMRYHSLTQLRAYMIHCSGTLRSS